MNVPFLAILVLTLCAYGVVAQDHGQRPTRSVTVRGEGVISVAPDQLRLSVQVSVRGETASSALKESSSRTAAILKIVKSMGVDPQQVQTSRVSVTPVVDYSRQVQPPPILGYTGNNDFTIVFKGALMERVGEFIDKATTAGATGFGSLLYESSRRRELERDALKQAAEDARARAVLLSKELNAGLGGVLSISESVLAPSPVYGNTMRLDAVSMEGGAPVMTGEITIRSTIDVVFELN